MPIDHLNCSPTDVILHLLANGRVKSAFTHQSIAEQILACFSALWIEITTEAERELRRADRSKNLRYTIETWADRGNDLLDILDAMHL
jgi:hypothetical protein